MDAIEAIRTRRSVRDYLDRAPPPALIEELVRDASHAPWTPISPPEPWVFNIIVGRDRIAGYGARALAYAREHRPSRHGYGWADDADFSVFYNAPAVVLISGRIGNRLALEECTRAGQILTIAAHARGLATCWVGSPNLWLADPDVWRELSIPEGFAPHAAFTLGYAARQPPRPSGCAARIIWADDAADPSPRG